MDFRVKEQRSFFNKCHDYISSYLKESTNTQSDTEDSDSSNNSSDEDDDPGSGVIVRPSFRIAGPYKKVATKDTRLLSVISIEVINKSDIIRSPEWWYSYSF